MKTNDYIVKEIILAVIEIKDKNLVEQLSMDNEESWDSMKQLTIITALENEFDIFIEASEASNLTSYDLILDFVNNHSEID